MEPRTMTVEEVQGRLAEVIGGLAPNQRILLTRDGKHVATLEGPPPPRRAPKLGTLKGSVLYMAPDFDAIPEGFEDYV